MIKSLLKYNQNEMCRKRHFKVVAVTTITIFNHFYNRSAVPFQLNSFSEPSHFLLNCSKSKSKLPNLFFHCFFVLACFLKKFTHFFFNSMNLNQHVNFTFKFFKENIFKKCILKEKVKLYSHEFSNLRYSSNLCYSFKAKRCV